MSVATRQNQGLPAARPVAAGEPGATVRRWLAVLVLGAMLAMAFSAVSRAQTDVKLIVTTQEEGYGRMVLTFPSLPAYKVNVHSGVLVLDFDEAIVTTVDDTTVRSPEFIVVGRVDPDGKALRFALAQDVRVNTMEAGEQLFIDLLPKDWKGVPPGLPAEVVAELARRAEDAERKAAREAIRKALESSKYKLRVHVGQQPTFSRIVFDWGVRVGAKLSREGDTITIAFDALTRPPLERLISDPPRYLKSVSSRFEEDGLKIDFKVDEQSDVRGFQEENTFVFDISSPEGWTVDDNEPVVKRTDDITADDEVVRLDAKRDAPEDADDAAADEEPVDRAEAELPAEKPEQAVLEPRDARRDVKPTLTEDPDLPEVVVSKLYLNSDGTGLTTPDELAAQRKESTEPGADVPAMAKAEPEQKPDGTRVGDPSEVAATKPDQEAKPADTDKAPRASGPLTVQAERDGEFLKLTFPFDTPTAAAVFRRADYLWLVFDSTRVLDLKSVAKRQDDYFSDVQVMNGDETQLVRFRLHGNTVSSAASDVDAWVLTLGRVAITPTSPVSLRRGLRSDGRAKVTVQFKNASKVHLLKDPEVGDKLFVVTGYGPQQGMVKRQDFVEFSVQKSAHGLSVRALTDDVRVRLRPDGVLITRAGGLTLSSSRMSGLDDVQSNVSDSSRLGFVDYERWAAGGPAEFSEQANLLERAIAELEPTQTLGPRLELTRLYLANDLGAEAMGQLDLITESDPELRAEPAFAAMRGVAHVLMHRPQAARQDLSSFGLRDDPHASLWRGLTEVQERKWSEALEHFRKGEFAIAEYPADKQVRFRIGALRAAVEANDFASADLHYRLLPKLEMSRGEAAEVRVLYARLLHGLGRSIEALDVLKEVLDIDDRKAEAEALFHYALLGRELDQIDRNQVREKLETLAATWRGDDLELQTLRLLASFYIADDEYRNALQVMKVAVTSYPRAQLSVAIHDDMTSLFENLYLDGKADMLTPVEALALYYEYRELTPVGRRGDEMIRKLADRLISVDLLDQAVEILEHQVDKRLIGAARAQVAAKLAMVHLMNRKPEQALQTIRRTRQAILPQQIQAQRRLIEARALSELGRTDSAVGLLARMDTADAVRLKAEAYWIGERWQMAGETFEQLLGPAGAGTEPLSAVQRTDVLRSAIAFVLADDRLGLDRLRQKFEAKIAGTPDESAFVVVTRPLNRDSIAFRNLAREIASIDTLESFLERFRKTFETLPEEPETLAQN